MKNNIFLVVMALCVSCTSSKQMGQAEEAEMLVKLERKGCRGYCPKYVLQLSSDRLLSFQGERNVAHLGEISREISAAEYDVVKTMLASEESLALDSLYDNGIVDAPFTHLWIQGEQGERKVSCRGDAPVSFERIVNHLEDLAQADGWLEQMDGPRELLIELTDPDQAVMLEEKFQSMDLKFVRRVSPRQNYFVFKADTQLMNASEIISQLSTNNLVKAVQWNKEIKRRD